jgi:hypothetical protein
MLPDAPVAHGPAGVYSGRVNPRSKQSDPRGNDERLVGFTSYRAQQEGSQMRQRDRYMSEEERRAEVMARDPAHREAQARAAAKRRDEEKRLWREAREQRRNPPHPPWEFSGTMPDG